MSITSFRLGRLDAFSAKTSRQREVLLDQLAGVGSLDLDDDLLPGRERRPVHLRDRAGGERLRLHRLEDVLPRDAELLLHHRDDLRLGERRHVVLQGRELFDELGREQVRSRREDLPELAERGTELLERGAEPLGLASPAHGALLVGPPEELPQAVLREDHADLRAAGHEMRVGHRFGDRRPDRGAWTPGSAPRSSGRSSCSR